MEEKDMQITTVDFYEQTLTVIEKEGEKYVAIRPIAEGIGLSWSSQCQKLTNNAHKFNCVVINTVASDGKQHEMLCIPLKKLNGYLFSINPEKVSERIKEKVVLYQEECFSVLYSYFADGYSINTRILSERPDQMRELAQLLKQLRTEEQSMYAIVRKVFKESSVDYDSQSQVAKSFFAMAQDKFHYAVTQKTVAELVLERADSTKENMGMTNFKKGTPTKADAKIAKNYLSDDELLFLENISEQFLLFAESKAFRGQKMTMEELSFKLNTLLTANDYPVLYEYKTYLRDKANLHAEQEFAKWKRNELANEQKQVKNSVEIA